jgi:hypothetical protein
VFFHLTEKDFCTVSDFEWNFLDGGSQNNDFLPNDTLESDTQIKDPLDLDLHGRLR